MAEGGDDGKRRCVLDVASAQGLQSYLKGALGAARAEAAAAPPPSGDAHRVRMLRAEGFASDVKALSKRVQDEGVRPEFARFFVTKKQADELGREARGRDRERRQLLMSSRAAYLHFTVDCTYYIYSYTTTCTLMSAPC